MKTSTFNYIPTRCNFFLNQLETELLLKLVNSKLETIKKEYGNDPTASYGNYTHTAHYAECMADNKGSLELIAIQLESHLNSFKEVNNGISGFKGN